MAEKKPIWEEMGPKLTVPARRRAVVPVDGTSFYSTTSTIRRYSYHFGGA
eukprot:COSAG02_NODE_11064_length_1802_cov_1.418673_2_plen_50_part_00